MQSDLKAHKVSLGGYNLHPTSMLSPHPTPFQIQGYFAHNRSGGSQTDHPNSDRLGGTSPINTNLSHPGCKLESCPDFPRLRPASSAASLRVSSLGGESPHPRIRFRSLHGLILSSQTVRTPRKEKQNDNDQTPPPPPEASLPAPPPGKTFQNRTRTKLWEGGRVKNRKGCPQNRAQGRKEKQKNDNLHRELQGRREGGKVSHSLSNCLSSR